MMFLIWLAVLLASLVYAASTGDPTMMRRAVTAGFIWALLGFAGVVLRR